MIYFILLLTSTFQVRTSKSNPAHIYAEKNINNPDCASRNLDRLSLPLGKCGMKVEETVHDQSDENSLIKSNKIPISSIYRACITIQLHPLFVTRNDRSYCAQCVYKNIDEIENFQQSLSVSDSMPLNLEPKFDLKSIEAKCSYEIRRKSINGPLIRYALLGETVYHIWKCQEENIQILVQNCYVEDDEGNRILVIDSNGCGVDEYILPTPVYSADRRTASQVKIKSVIHVFKFAEKELTRFTCQIRVCSMINNTCQNFAVCFIIK
ncbi:unnamed protein product [Thelazia callipaeda]|uniref:ZP domain-containing protein n=1 Tax=Thelazia callipaeda TaxID=103827 RepID=A0A0N5CZI9_THECL|nr:unnamed protein product [Thelazia callipaeda]